ncbi:hypothetical protein, partial [Corynebacterium sp.]|uniref:hypothetical protein n=1 Tax=Corynebacterium sp. TaxID=1720 RepID=UPI0026DFCD5B
TDQLLILSGLPAVPWPEIALIVAGLLLGMELPVIVGALALVAGLLLGMAQLDTTIWDFIILGLGVAATAVLLAVPPGPVMFMGLLIIVGPALLVAGGSATLRRYLARRRV